MYSNIKLEISTMQNHNYVWTDLFQVHNIVIQF